MEKRAINAYLEDYMVVFQMKNLNLISGKKCSIADTFHEIIESAKKDPQFAATFDKIKKLTEANILTSEEFDENEQPAQTSATESEK